MWTAKTVKRPPQQPAQPRYANYWAPLTRKRPIPPHPAQPRHTNDWAPRMQQRHQQEHRLPRPTEHSDPTQYAKGRTGHRKETTTRRNVTQGGTWWHLCSRSLESRVHGGMHHLHGQLGVPTQRLRPLCVCLGVVSNSNPTECHTGEGIVPQKQGGAPSPTNQSKSHFSSLIVCCALYLGTLLFYDWCSVFDVLCCFCYVGW